MLVERLLDIPRSCSRETRPAAEEIGRVLAGLPPPSEADYRRAASAAYFALFHTVTLEAARFLVDRPGGFGRHRAARDFGHRHVRVVALWASGGGSPPPQLASTVADLNENGQVLGVADDIGLLSDERTAADYDHFAQFTEARALGAIRVATRAIRVIEQGSFANGEAGRTFLEMIADQARARL